MKMAKIIAMASLATAIVGAGCSSKQTKLSQSAKSVEYVVETPHLKRITRYERAKVWLKDMFPNLDVHGFRVDNKNGRHLVGSASVPCNELRDLGDRKDYVLTFLVDVSMRPNKTVLSFDNLEIKPSAKNADFHRNKITHNIETRQDLTNVAGACLNPVRSSLAAKLNSPIRNRAIASQKAKH